MVPLRDHGYCAGVLANATGDGPAYGYFFGPRVATASEVNSDLLRAEDAVLVGKFGDLEICKGNWPVIGVVEPWEPKKWPMLPLARVDESVHRAWLSTYDENLECVEEVEIDADEARKHPYDRMMGAGAVEIRLTKLMDEAN